MVQCVQQIFVTIRVLLPEHDNYFQLKIHRFDSFVDSIRIYIHPLLSRPNEMSESHIAQ